MSSELDRVVAAHYRRKELLSRNVTALAVQVWDALGPSGFREESLQVAGLVAAGQLAAASQSGEYVSAATAAQGVRTANVIVPRAFAGVAADGRSLESLVNVPVSQTWDLLKAGVDYRAAEASGKASLTQIVSNEVKQAGSDATTVAMVGEPEVRSWIRVTHRPSCPRCIVLAGKTYGWKADFDRHPGCDCDAVPNTGDIDADEWVTDPDEYFNSLSEPEQDTFLGKKDAKAVRDDDADMTSLINTRRSKKSGLSGFGGTTKRVDKSIRRAGQKTAARQSSVELQISQLQSRGGNAWSELRLAELRRELAGF